MKHHLHALLKRLHLLKIARKTLEVLFDIIRPMKYKGLDIYSYFELIVLRIRAKTLLKKWQTEGYCGINDTPRDTPLIVSLTSYPARLHALHLSIMSIMEQSIKADKIILWLKKAEFVNINNIPAALKTLQEFGLSIDWIDENTRSFAKLIPCKEKYPDAIIVTIDDDILYHKNCLEQLYKTHLDNPTYIIGYNGMILSKENAHSLNSFFTMSEHTEILGQTLSIYNIPSPNNFLQGNGGILYPPHSLHEDLFLHDRYKELCPHADDIWFNAMAILGNTPRYIIKSDEVLPFRTIGGIQKTGLHLINLVGKQNDVQFKKVFDYYYLYQYIE